MAVSEALQKRRPSHVAGMDAGEVTEALARPSVAAFPDRSLRLREGEGARNALMPRNRQRADIEWVDLRAGAGGEDAAAAAFQENLVRGGAGMPSHMVQYNRLPGAAWDTDAASPAAATTPARESRGMRRALAFDDDDDDTPRCSEDAEVEFRRALGTKIRTGSVPLADSGRPATHWAVLDQEDLPVEGGRAAGNFIQDREANPLLRGMRRQPWQACHGDPSERTVLGMVLCPNESDPPPPRQITAYRRGAGACSQHFSDISTQQAVRASPEIFRFAVLEGAASRCRSLPPDLSGAAGVASALNNAHSSAVRFCCTPRRPRPAGEASQEGTGNARNRSRSVTGILDDDRTKADLARERALRLHGDKNFADLCRATLEMRQAAVCTTQAIKMQTGKQVSENMRERLTWQT